MRIAGPILLMGHLITWTELKTTQRQTPGQQRCQRTFLLKIKNGNGTPKWQVRYKEVALKGGEI
jgi:hypothetical protein